MIARWSTEHRRLLTATTAAVVLIAVVVVVVAAGGVSSAAQATRRRPAADAVRVVARRQLAGEQALLTRLQMLASRESAEISSLTAQLRVLGHRNRHRRHHRR